jgi:hypothetical protein
MQTRCQAPRRSISATSGITQALDRGENGHARRLGAALTVSQRAAVLDQLDRLVAEHRGSDGSLALPRAMTLVTATV